MAFNEQTMDASRRTVYFELVDRPGTVGAARIAASVLLPYSKSVVGGVEYVETNATTAINEGGGSHAVPPHGLLAGQEYRERSKGISSVDVPTGTTLGSPGESVLHKFGWI